MNAALANFTKALAEQGLQDDVNVTWIHPGLTDGAAGRHLRRPRPAAVQERGAGRGGSHRRRGYPPSRPADDLAELVAFLCSPAAHIHGTGIVMDGGGAKGYYVAFALTDEQKLLVGGPAVR